MDQNEFGEYIKKARPNTKDSSIKVYYGIYNKLIGLAKPEGLGAWPLVEKNTHLWEFYTGLVNKNITNNSTKRNYFVVLMILTEAANGGKYTDKWEGLEEWQKYKGAVDHLNNLIKQVQMANGGLTDKQKENMATDEEIKKLINTLENGYVKSINKFYRQIKKDGIERPTTAPFPHKMLDNHTAYVLFKMYEELPIRNEIANLKHFYGKKYINENRYKNYAHLISKQDNYLVWAPGTKTFHMVRNKYKTSGVHGEIITELSKGLSKVIFDYMQTWPHLGQVGEYVFPNLMNSEHPELNITKLLSRVSLDIIKKKISSRMMTKIGISTPEVAQAVSVLQNVADTRGTNVGTIATNYVVQQ